MSPVKPDRARGPKSTDEALGPADSYSGYDNVNQFAMIFVELFQ